MRTVAAVAATASNASVVHGITTDFNDGVLPLTRDALLLIELMTTTMFGMENLMELEWTERFYDFIIYVGFLNFVVVADMWGLYVIFTVEF